MKISIENFKSIRLLRNFEIKPFTVISGVNSSGKSSFIQLLLLLKQTIEIDSSSKPLCLDGYFYKVNEFKDIIHNKDFKNNLKVSFEFNRDEFDQIKNPTTISLYNSFGNYKCLIEIHYLIKNNKASINFFSIIFSFPEGNDNQYISFSLNAGNSYSIDTNTGIFGTELWKDKPPISNIHYSSIYPIYYESKKEEVVKIGNKKIKNTKLIKQFINIEDIKVLLNSFFKNISYIGPLREQPKDEYTISENNQTVGKTGEFVAQILDEYSSEPTEFYKIREQKNGIIIYEKATKSLIHAVNYWMCEVFDVTYKIHVKKTDDIYKIILKNKAGLSTSIKHVGFGISQLLPIIVEGLRIPRNGTLILEQPEIHLHPKIQSLLYDFLYGLTKLGKTVIIETHSSHFITRMRRRIAEDESNKMDDHINLTFIENNNFRTIELDDYGTLDYYPTDFIEPSNTELKAIVKAQMNKRTKNE